MMIIIILDEIWTRRGEQACEVPSTVPTQNQEVPTTCVGLLHPIAFAKAEMTIGVTD